MLQLIGLGISPGLARGRALVVRQQTRDVRYRILPEAVASECARLDAARARSRAQLREIQAHVSRTAGPEYAALFDAQLLMLDDPLFMGRADAFIREGRVNASWAAARAAEDIAARLLETDDPYLRDRRGDLADVVGRLRMNLRSPGRDGTAELLRSVPGPCVIVADDLPPSMAAQVDWSRVAGFATDAGTRTYHTAILARSLRVPAVVGLHDASRRIAPGTPVVLDGATGELLVDPPEDLAERLATRHAARVAEEHRLGELRELPATTADGVAIRLHANLELPDDATQALACGAEGVGLYRSEFLLANRSIEQLTEDVQCAAYCDVLQRMQGREVTIRTFDAGEEQLGRSPASPGAFRTRLGLRAIRLSLSLRALFRTQLRALLRAAPHGQLRIMFPFISGADELREARQVLAEAAGELRQRGESAATVPVGAMIEVPSAALTADLIAPEADFLSLGTNDLIQYALAADRTDDRMQQFYEPLHPAILRMVRQVQRVGRRHNMRVSVCGEMASDPLVITILLGLGITEFSMTPVAIPAVKQVIRSVHLVEARRIARAALRAATPGEIKKVSGITEQAPDQSEVEGTKAPYLGEHRGAEQHPARREALGL
jgi:phosphotransferase system enzyme I (PtsI)